MGFHQLKHHWLSIRAGQGVAAQKPILAEPVLTPVRPRFNLPVDRLGRILIAELRFVRVIQLMRQSALQVADRCRLGVAVGCTSQGALGPVMWTSSVGGFQRILKDTIQHDYRSSVMNSDELGGCSIVISGRLHPAIMWTATERADHRPED